jgi:predicted short-subunit dehydrogenase-like oxidoreductase (DUF2520 family)
MELRSACVVGAGRVGRAVAARLGESVPTRTVGRDLDIGEADLVLLCVPDRAIAEVASGIPAGPWLAHTSGARRLSELDPHERRFSLHPLQTFTHARGPEQLGGAWAAVSGESAQATETGFELARLLGLEPFELDDAERPAYHAGAAIASNFLVTIHWAAAELFQAAGAPPEALEPLMRRTIENGFELTGPIARGDWETVESHLAEIRARRPQLEPMYRALSETTATVAAL